MKIRYLYLYDKYHARALLYIPEEVLKEAVEQRDDKRVANAPGCEMEQVYAGKWIFESVIVMGNIAAE